MRAVDVRPTLEYLSVETAGLAEEQEFLQLIQEMPRLTYLDVGDLGGRAGTPGAVKGPPFSQKELPSIHLPALKTLCCRLWMAPALLGGLSVTTVDFDEGIDLEEGSLSEWEEIMERDYLPGYFALRHVASRTLTSLTLPPSRTIMQRIATDFPLLKELRFRCQQEWNESVVSLYIHLPKPVS